jgi:hypothetical protein
MSKDRKNPETVTKNRKRRAEKDPETGLTFLYGPKITKEKVKKLFPRDTDHDVINVRRSVGL